MKFAMNGALTIGTLDGANVEIRQEVGAENFFLFGLTAEQVDAAQTQRLQSLDRTTKPTPSSSEVLDQIASGHFSTATGASSARRWIPSWASDEYMLLADFAAYLAAQNQVDQA